jgi:C_GCAxxG_C_C family probable redox protein
MEGWKPDMKQSNEAVECFTSGFSCSQAVFSTFAEKMGMDRQMALGVAGAFGGGMVGRGETCGVVTGALMVLGLKYAKRQPGDNAAKEHTYALAEEFIHRFESQRGSIICRSLVGYDLSIPAEHAAAKDSGIFRETCPELVREAVLILEDIL